MLNTCEVVTTEQVALRFGIKKTTAKHLLRERCEKEGWGPATVWRKKKERS